jgi:hypothetical protein
MTVNFLTLINETFEECKQPPMIVKNALMPPLVFAFKQ